MLFCGEFKKEMYAVVAGVGIFHPGHPGFGLLIFAFFFLFYENHFTCFILIIRYFIEK